MKIRGLFLTFLVCALLVAPWAQALEVGDQAPPLTIDRWVKNPVDPVYDGERVAVIEMWATWCGTCHSVVPLLSQLQTQYSDSVRIVALSFEPISDIEQYMATYGSNIEYSVARDRGDTWLTYKDGFYSHVTVVDQGGRIVWRGPSDELAGPLAQAVDAGLFIANTLSNTVVNEGEDVTFALNTVNDTPATFAWTRDGEPIGDNSPTLTLQNVTDADEGAYACTVTKVGDSRIVLRRGASLMVVPTGGSVPATSPLGVALLAGALSLAGVCVLASTRKSCVALQD